MSTEEEKDCEKSDEDVKECCDNCSNDSCERRKKDK